MRFETPLALLLFLILSVLAWLGWPARGPNRGREALGLGLRLVIALSLILALAGLDLVSRVDRLAVVFLLDHSDSIAPPVQAEELALLRQALQKMRPDDQAAVVVFGADALVERAMSPARDLGEISSTPARGQTDLGSAVRLGMALFPAHSARRIVLISDGINTQGDALAAARLARSSGVQIEAVRVGQPPAVEAQITAVDAPRALQQGERFDLQISLSASQAMNARVRVLADGQVVYTGEQKLQAGEQSFSLSLEAVKTGFVRYQVQIEPQLDTYYQNNSLETFVQVAGPPRVLLVAPRAGESTGLKGEVRPDEAAQLSQALQAAQYSVERVEPSGLPADLPGLAGYASVVLVDVPARELTLTQMESLQSYVRDLGGGLLAVGGPTSYGVGGYFKTPLEETLPLEMQLKDEKRRPSLAIVFIIDHSGSMGETSGGAAKLELAKEAAIRSVDLLFPTDRVGVIAFDDSAAWVVPMTALSEPKAVQNAIAGIKVGGGTDILAGLQAMAKVLPNDLASVKHVILLTDGGADPSGIPELVKRLHDENGITLTTVGVGQDAADYLPRLAELGGGRYHFAADPGSIPSIFTEETSLVTRSYIIEHGFFPAQAGPSPILAGLQGLPRLQGYVGTSAKATAQTILVSDLDDPILAAWQYGLGRAVAFTSDATGRWAQDWLTWKQFADFWAQALRNTIRDRAPSALDVRVESGVESGQPARLSVDARSETGAALNGYHLQARVVAPDGQAQNLDLVQVAPGEYAAPFSAVTPGAYLVGVSGTPPVGEALVDTAGWVLPYSAEYKMQADSGKILEQMAALTGGRLLDLKSNPGEVFAHTLPAGGDIHPMWPWLVLLAAVLLPLDIAARRLLIGPADARAWLARLRRLPRREAAAQPRSSRMEALIQAKQRAIEGIDLEAEKEKGGLQEQPAAGGLPSAAQVEAAKDDIQPEAKLPGDGLETPRAGEGQSTAASLLAAKRERKKKL